MWMRLKRIFTLLVFIGVLGACAASQETADTKERLSGPRQLIISYRSTPAKRVAFRQYMLKTGIRRFDQLKKDGMLEDYRLLFNRYVDADTWDMLSVLTFKDYANVAKWAAVEREAPGGLAEEGLTLATPINTYSLDLIWHGSGEPKATRGKTLFFVIPYDYYPHTIDEYMKYVDVYVMPQIRGWVSEGIVANYGIYLSRYPTSRPWKSIFLLEYRDDASFGTREATMAKVRAALKDNPAWKTASDKKLNMRVEKESVIADELIP